MTTSDIAGLSGWVAVLPLMALLLASLWVVRRTDSFHVLRLRLWQLAHGSRPIEDAPIRAFIEEQTSLAAFRAFSGIELRTRHEAHALLTWCEERGVNAAALRYCGPYFDGATRTVRPTPGRLGRAVRFAGLGSAFAACVFAAWMAVQPSALLSWRATGTYFWSNASEARPWWVYGFAADRLSAVECQALERDSYRHRHFAPKEAEALCQMFATEPGRAYLGHQVREWRQAMLLTALASLVPLWMAFWAVVHVTTARALARRKLDPSPKGGQLAFDFGP